jgi:N-acetylmuramoyl-L-alanine amidase
MREINEIILHCSATWSKQDIGAAEIERWHTMPKSKGGRGWAHIGYHFVIRRNGKIENGCPIATAGIHCSGHNAKSIGICLVGGGPMGEDNNFTDAQFHSLSFLITQIRNNYPLTTIHGHNEFAQKACPVFSVAKFLAEYNIPKDPWDSQRWPHFKPKEFSALWGKGKMPPIWEQSLDALEKLRTAYGKALVITKSEWNDDFQRMIIDLRIPASFRAVVTKRAIEAGFISSRATDTGVRVYMEQV